MRKFKLYMALIIIAILPISCNNTQETLEPSDTSDNLSSLSSQELSNVEVSMHLNTAENRQAVMDLLNNTELQAEALQSYQEQASTSGINHLNTEDLLLEYQSCTTCANEYRDFLYPMFEELIVTENANVLTVLESYEAGIVNFSDDMIIQENLRFIFFTIEQTVLKRKDGIGKHIGKGIVNGFIAGCIGGGYAGATTGTAVVPVIGTVSGGVAGCIAGGTVSAAVGIVVGIFWWAVS